MRRGRQAPPLEGIAEKAMPPPPKPARQKPEVPSGGNGRRPLGDLLVEAGLVAPAKLNEALLQQEASGKRIGSLLVELGELDERKLTEVLGKQLKLPVIDLRTTEPDGETAALLPESAARALVAIPVRRHDGRVVVALADPVDESVLQGLREGLSADAVLLTLAAPSDIRRAIDNAYRALAGVDRLIEEFEVTDSARRSTAEPTGTITDDAPVVQVVNLTITQALRDRASDIHIEPQDERVRVRYRIDGALHDVLALPAKMGPAIVSRLKIMAGMNIVERRRPQDGQIVTEVDGRPVDIRINTTPTIWGEKTVMRLLDRSRSLHRLDDLGMPSATYEAFVRLVKAPFGMVICAGPTGSGKTTTLYATLADINQSERNITTIEDPVEYVFSSINQIQINESAGISFADGLRSILRQDPDVILVGEIRDVETARIAVQSALSGHFVLSSLHATDAAAALLRFIDMGIENFLVASSVVGVASQRLVRRTCPHCRTRYKPSVEELAFYREAGGPPKTEFVRGEGCNFCSHTGFRERIGVYELLPVTTEIKELVVTGAPHDAIYRAAVAAGMRSLLDEGVRLVREDTTTIAEIMRAIYTI
jgi:type IV pilus assembly protein PilB